MYYSLLCFKIVNLKAHDHKIIISDFLQKMKTCLLSIFLLYSVHGLEAPLDGEDEGVRKLLIVITIINIIITIIIIIVFKTIFVLVLMGPI